MVRLASIHLLVINFFLSCGSAKISNSVRDFLEKNSAKEEPTPIVLWHGMGKCILNFSAYYTFFGMDSLQSIQLSLGLFGTSGLGNSIIFE